MKYFKVVHNIQVYVRQKFKKPGDCYAVVKLNEKDASLLEGGLVIEITESEYSAWLASRNALAIKATTPTTKINGPVSVGSKTKPEPKVEVEESSEPKVEPEVESEPESDQESEPEVEPEVEPEPKVEDASDADGDTVKPGWDEFGPLKGTPDYKPLSSAEKRRLGKLRKARSKND